MRVLPSSEKYKKTEPVSPTVLLAVTEYKCLEGGAPLKEGSKICEPLRSKTSFDESLVSVPTNVESTSVISAEHELVSFVVILLFVTYVTQLPTKVPGAMKYSPPGV